MPLMGETALRRLWNNIHEVFYDKVETDKKIGDTNTNLTNLQTTVNGKVPETRKVAGKPLTGDITLEPNDVGMPTEQELLKKIYPVGSLWFSTSTTNPGTIITGTTWEKIEGKYLFAADSSHGANRTGGNASVSYTPSGTISKASGTTGASSAANTGAASGNTGSTTLNTNQIPKHTHGFRDYWNTAWDGSVSNRQAVAANGQNQGLDNSASRTYAYTLENNSSQQGHTHTLNNHTHTMAHTHSLTMNGQTFTGTAANINLTPVWYGVYVWRRTA